MKILKKLAVVFLMITTSQLHANQCLSAINLLPERINIPKKLLIQIAKVESGFGPQRMPWPWSIQVQGKSYYFRNEDAAALYINRLLALGIKNFDVGCHQINYFWHQDKVRIPQELLNPLKNTSIAAQFLVSLKAQHHSWLKAVAHYHSTDPQKGLAYAKLVFTS